LNTITSHFVLRRRLTLLLLVLVVLVAGFVYAATPYARAASLIVRGAHLGGRLEAFAENRSYDVDTRPAQTIPTRYGPVPARFYVPERSIGYPVIVIPGIHSAGIEEGRLTALSHQLAATGLTVMTMALPDLQAYRITPHATDTIEDAVSWLAARHDIAPDGKVGVVGISFAGGLSLAAASRPSIKDKLAYVLSFGGHGDLPRVMRYLASGEETPVPGVTVPPPHDYGVGVILYGLADRGVVPADQVAPLRQGIATFLLGSQQTVLTPALAVNTFAEAREYEKTLPEPSRTYLHYVNERNTKKLGAVLLPYLNQGGADDPSLSPDRTPAVPTAPVYLLHGIEDTVIPAAESALLAEDLRRRGADVHLLLSGLITHADVSKNVPVTETLKLVEFWGALLKE
jgi:dienelactone hydrolase